MWTDPSARGAVTPELRDEVWRAIMARKDLKPKRGRDTIHFRCIRPDHNDSNPSAWARDVMHGCMGCGFMEPLTTLARDLGVEITMPDKNYTVEQYAREKGLDLKFLLSLGVRTEEVRGHDAVAIPYKNASGDTLRIQYRGPSGGQRFWWGEGHGVWPYGLDRLPQNPDKPVLLVEGASDCHAAWQNGVLAIGVPGANAWKREWKEFLKDRKIYIWQEPDKGGEQFVESLRADLVGSRVIKPSDVKDLCELHQKENGNFLTALKGLFSQPKVTVQPPAPFDSLSGPTLDRLRSEINQPISAVPTPWPSWNTACRGRGGRVGPAHKWHVMIAGRSGHGKTMVALNVAASAMAQGEKVMFVSLEMDQLELSTRLMAMTTGTEMGKLEPGTYFDGDAYKAAARELDRLKERGGEMFVNRRPINRLKDIVHSIQWGYEHHGCTTFVVDYLQLSRPEGRQEVWDIASAASTEIRHQAKDLGVLTIGISQFKRATSSESEKRPEIEGMFGSASLENDADQVILIDHSRYEREGHEARLYLLLAKNRHGPTAEWPIIFDYSNVRMREALPDEESSYAIGA